MRHARFDQSVPSLGLALAVALGASSPAVASAADPAEAAVRITQTWIVAAAPAGAWDVYLTGTRLQPGFWTGPHTHPGPEYGLIADGRAQRWDAGVRRTVSAGEGYFSAAGTVHEGGDTSDAEVLQLSTHLIPSGGTFQTPVPPEQAPADAPKAAPAQTRLWQVKFPLDAPPPAPFRLTEEVVDVPAASDVFAPHAYEGLTLGVVMDGSLAVTQDGATTTYTVGQGFRVPANAQITLHAATGASSRAMLTVIGKT